MAHFKKIPEDQMQIYSDDIDSLPPKLRLPITSGKPSPIILFTKEKFYFSYDAEQNSAQCQSNDKNCEQSGNL